MIHKTTYKRFQIPIKYGIYIAFLGLIMPLSGKEMLKLYEKAGWVVLRQKGSHVVLGKGAARVTIPMHKEIKIGLEKALLKALGGNP